MNKEMLPENMSRDQGLERESLPNLRETNKKKRGLVVILFMAIGIGILVSASIFLTPYLSSFGGRAFHSISGTTETDSPAIEVAAILEPSFEAIDARGTVIDSNKGIASSDQITISGYSQDTYNTKLYCSIDTLPIHCNGGPIEILGLPDGNHELRIVEPGNGETIIRVFEWKSGPTD
jgi:hypothetical protein